MIFLNECPEKWAKRYGILLNDIECPKCKEFLELNKPIALTGYRGLETAPCKKCKHKSGITKLVPVGDKLEFWEQFRP